MVSSTSGQAKQAEKGGDPIPTGSLRCESIHSLTVVIPMCFLNYIKRIWQSNTPIYSQITLTATCFDSKESSPGYLWNHT